MTEFLTFIDATDRYWKSSPSEILPDMVDLYSKTIVKIEPDSPPIVKEKDPKHVAPVTCVICGDVATGYHYEVGSCNGCKTFFRRAVLSQKKYMCKKNFKCKDSINKEVRSRCRRCRFDRCVDAGMNPLLILSVAVPRENTVIKEILAKRKLELDDGNEPSTSQDTKLFVAPKIVEMTMDRLIENLLHLESAHQRLRRSKYIPSRDEDLTLDILISGHSRLGVDFGDMPPVKGRPIRKIIPIERRIRERIPFVFPSQPKETSVEVKIWLMADLAYSVEYLKTFQFFHKLKENDKRVLAGNVALMCSQLTQSFYSYEHKKDITLYPDGCLWNNGHIDDDAEFDQARHINFIQVLKNLNMDKKEYVLLKAIITCNPALENLSPDCRGMMHEQREKYASSLISYVIARRGVHEGPSAFAAIMSICDTLTRLARKHKDYRILFIAYGLIVKKETNKLNFFDEIMEL